MQASIYIVNPNIFQRKVWPSLPLISVHSRIDEILYDKTRSDIYLPVVSSNNLDWTQLIDLRGRYSRHGDY
jgi:hypothetical protein